MGSYAKETSVSVEKSRAEIESTLTKFGATAFAYATNMDKAMVQFQANNRRIMFVLVLPDRNSPIFTHSRGKTYLKKFREDQAYVKWEQACRQKWRSLALSIKAKMVAVDDGISTFEDEFLSHIVMPDGKTVSSHIKPMIENAYQTGKMVPLLPHFDN